MKLRPLHLILVAIAALLLSATGASAALAVSRVEPPSWWAGHSLNPLRVMFTGTNLTQATITPPAGFAVSNLVVTSGGSRIFCDLFIPADARPGPREFTLQNQSARATASFSISPALDPKSRFAGFSPDDVIYLLMPDRFANGDPANDRPAQSPDLLDRFKPRHYHGGDLQGVINRLPYLKELGVTALWLTPWYDNVNHVNTRETYNRDNQRTEKGHPVTDYHGYGAVDFYAVEEHFGDLAKLRELVDAAHALGLKVIQDQVANHTGPYHPWVRNPPTPAWFNGSEAQHLDNSWQTWTIAERNPPQDKLKSTLEGWFINVLPDLNQNDPETATYLIQNSLWWVGMTGVDAIRQDTLPYVPRSYWAKWTFALKRQYPNLTILGEMFDANPKLVSFFQGGRSQFDGVDSGVETLFDFPLHFAIRDVFARGQPMTKLVEVLSADTNYVTARPLVTFIGLHDTPRFLGERGATLEGLQLAFTYLLTTRGTPMIYYGDEIGLTGGGDPYNRADFPGGWPEDARSAFTPAGRTPEQARIHDHVRKLISLRAALRPLRQGDMLPLTTTQQTHAFARLTKDSSVLVAFNNSDRPQSLRLTLPASLATQSRWFNRLGDDSPVTASNGELTLQLPAKQAVILAPEPTAEVTGSDAGKSTSSIR